ncbi:hypothetical protein EPN18_00580 [bacterium]|nr:MAG: hypothetical protein EPN18_00580 [bacterium]
MTKKTVIAAVLLACLALAPRAWAVDEKTSTSPPDAKNQKDNNNTKTLEAKIKSNRVFLKAAEKVVRNAKSGEAGSYFKKAQGLFDEAMTHYERGERQFALEDISESTRMAIYAITLSTSPEDSIREAIIEEEMLINAEHEHQQKKRLIAKGTAEVEIFIEAAERLLKDKPNKESAKRIDATKKLLLKAKESAAENLYDDALWAIDEAYGLATHSVKDIKQSQGEIITFPKIKFHNEDERFAYELKKNDTYIFFAEQTIKENDKEGTRFFLKAMATRFDALIAHQNRDISQAVEKIISSTSLMIKAIQAPPGK